MEIHTTIYHLKRSCRHSHQLFKDFTIHIYFLTFCFFQNLYTLDLTHFRQRGDNTTIPYPKPKETEMML